MKKLKLIELVVVADPIPDDKGKYFDDVGTPQERPKILNFCCSGMRLATTVELECPVCLKTTKYKGQHAWSDMWTWGLGGQLDKALEIETRNLQNKQAEYRCPHCGSSSTLDDASIEKFCQIVRDSVGKLPDEGAEWALQAYQGFMVMHNWGLRDFQYRVIPTNFSGTHFFFEWLLDKCGCEEYCQPSAKKGGRWR